MTCHNYYMYQLTEVYGVWWPRRDIHPQGYHSRAKVRLSGARVFCRCGEVTYHFRGCYGASVTHRIYIVYNKSLNYVVVKRLISFSNALKYAVI